MGPLRILIVDDDPMVAEAITDLVSSFGHSPVTVNSGEAALSLMRKDQFDLAILDLELPGIIGIDAARAMVGMQPGIKILFSTGYSKQEEQIDTSAGYFHGIIRKPFDINDLKAAIENTGLSL